MSRTDVLVSTSWAERHLDSSRVVFVEVDEDASAYEENHVPGAVALDWFHDLLDPVRRDLLQPRALETLLSGKGISNDHTVVLYGGNDNWFAAYAYWYLRLHGHRDVRLLDGGRRKWELERRPLTDRPTLREHTLYRARQPNAALRAGRDEVLASIGRRNFVDVRGPEEFHGHVLAPAHLQHEAGLRAGRIPGAINVPWQWSVNDNGTFRDDDQLRHLFTEAGLDPARDTIVYCRIGERSSHTWFVLHELLDHPSVKNYDGSWTEYGSLIGVPIERD